MSSDLAWIAPLAWGLVSLVALMAFNAPRSARGARPAPPHAARRDDVRDAA